MRSSAPPPTAGLLGSRVVKGRFVEIGFAWGKARVVGLAPLQKVVGDFCRIKFGGFCRGFSWRIFLGTFSPQK